MPCITTSSFMKFELNPPSKLVVIKGCLNSGGAKRLFKIINNSIKNESVLKLKAYKREGAFGAGG